MGKQRKLFSKEFWLSDFAVIGYISLLSLILHLIAIEGFGYFRDEFYYIACSDHLAFGYVDHPPLAMLLLKLIRLVLGNSLIAIRILPVLGGALFVFLTGVISRELGGKKYAILLASVAAFAPFVNFFTFSIFSMNFLDLLFWQLLVLIVIRIIKLQEPKRWLLFGLVAGLGFQNKISVAFLVFGIFLGILLSKERWQLRCKFFWTGAVITGLLSLPYLLWNMAHDWPTLEFIRNAKAYKMAALTPLDFLLEQIITTNPATLLIWLAGLWYFFFNKEGRQYRLFGWMFLSIYILFTVQQAKAYYLAPAYPILFAGGAIQIASWWRKKGTRWLRPVLIVTILAVSLIVCPLVLPILSVEKTINHIQWIGIEGNSGEKHEQGTLPQHYADMHGWEKMVATVADVYRTLPPEDQASCAIFVWNYGGAGAIDLLGKKYNLPGASCTHNNYWFWGPGHKDPEVVIMFGTSQDPQKSLEDLRSAFEEVIHAATFTCTHCMPYENNRPIFICRKMKQNLNDFWQRAKHFN